MIKVVKSIIILVVVVILGIGLLIGMYFIFNLIKEECVK